MALVKNVKLDSLVVCGVAGGAIAVFKCATVNVDIATAGNRNMVAVAAIF